MEKKVSIIIPAYNCGKYISKCLDSLLCQTYTNFEAIVVDNNSKDNTADIVKLYAQNDDRIKYFYYDKGGVSATRNYAISVSRGDYIYFADADDEIMPDALNTMVRSMSFGYDFVKYNYYYSKEDNKEYKLGHCNYTGFIDRADRRILSSIIDGSIPTFVWTMMVKKEFISDITFDERIDYMEDKVFYYEIFNKSHNYLISNEPVYYYYFNSFDKKSDEYWIKYLKNVNLVYGALIDIACKYDTSFIEEIKTAAFLQINNNLYNLYSNHTDSFTILDVKKYLDMCDSRFLTSIKVHGLYHKLCLLFLKSGMLLKLYQFKYRRLHK